MRLQTLLTRFLPLITLPIIWNNTHRILSELLILSKPFYWCLSPTMKRVHKSNRQHHQKFASQMKQAPPQLHQRLSRPHTLKTQQIWQQHSATTCTQTILTLPSQKFFHAHSWPAWHRKMQYSKNYEIVSSQGMKIVAWTATMRFWKDLHVNYGCVCVDNRIAIPNSTNDAYVEAIHTSRELGDDRHSGARMVAVNASRSSS